MFKNDGFVAPPQNRTSCTAPIAILVIGLISLLTALGLELVLSVTQQSQTFDEACHVFAGYHYGKNSDFGINPEHPPLVKLVAAAPLLQIPLLDL
jgi:hypothetical protein